MEKFIINLSVIFFLILFSISSIIAYNTDWYLKFNSSDLYRDIKEDETYKFKVY